MYIYPPYLLYIDLYIILIFIFFIFYSILQQIYITNTSSIFNIFRAFRAFGTFRIFKIFKVFRVFRAFRAFRAFKAFRAFRAFRAFGAFSYTIPKTIGYMARCADCVFSCQMLPNAAKCCKNAGKFFPDVRTLINNIIRYSNCLYIVAIIY